MDSQRMVIVKEVWRAMEAGGVVAARDALLPHCREDAEFRPYLGDGTVLHGASAFARMVDDIAARAIEASGKAYSFTEEGDSVVVLGQMRLREASGALREAQARWTFEFDDDDRVVRMVVS